MLANSELLAKRSALDRVRACLIARHRTPRESAAIRIAHRARNSEIREQRFLLLGDENVVRLHITVHVSRTVRVFERARHFARDAQRIRPPSSLR
jgi:hypothetical protein